MRYRSGKRRYSGTALVKLFIHELKSTLTIFFVKITGREKKQTYKDNCDTLYSSRGRHWTV
jgi:hypothetical protein